MQATNNFSHPNYQQQVNYKNFAFEKTAIIKPPFEEFRNKEVHHKLTRFVIDSRDRNMRLYPTPSAYEIDLDEEIEDVTAADVILADVPFSAYTVNSGNNQLDIKVGSSIYTAIIDPGDYNVTTLPNALQTAIRQVAGPGFEVAFNETKDNFVISSSSDFSLSTGDENSNYKSKSIAKLLGFEAKPMLLSVVGAPNASGYTYHAIPTFRKDFNINKYIIMHIDGMNVNHSINTATNRSLALIHKQYSALSMLMPAAVRKTFNPPIGRLTKVRISFKDYFGNPYDFQNQDHRIEILFESSKHLRKYMDFV